MAKTSNISGEFRIAWTVFYDKEELTAQQQSTITRRALYDAPTTYDLNGLEGDATMIRKTATVTGHGPKVIATTNGMGSTEKNLFPDDPDMAKEALKMKYKLGPILADLLSVSNPRENPTGTKGIFFGTVGIVANERLVPGDLVMVDMSDPSKPAKTYGKGRMGTSRNTRRPLIYVKYTHMIPSASMMRHIRSVLDSPQLYKQLRTTNPRTAQAWLNAVNYIFQDDMFTAALTVNSLLPVFAPREGVTELRDDNGNELPADEITVRVAQYLHAIPLDRARKQKRDASVNGAKLWEEVRLRILNMKYYDGKNTAYEFGYVPNGRQPTSSARDLKENKIKSSAEGDLLKQQLNGATRRIVSTLMASDFSKLWVVGTMIVGARPGEKGVLLMTQTKV